MWRDACNLLGFISGLALIFSGCAGKQIEQVHVRFIPESKRTVFVGLPLNSTAQGDLPPWIQKSLIEYYQNSRELTLTRDFPSADLYLEVEIATWIETPVVDLKQGQVGQSRYLMKTLVSFRDVSSKSYPIKEKPIEISVVGPGRRLGESLPEAVGRGLMKRLSFCLDALVLTGTAPQLTLYGYEGLEEDFSRSWTERQNLGALDPRNRDIRDRPESDFLNGTNDSETNRLRAIQERDRRGNR